MDQHDRAKVVLNIDIRLGCHQLRVKVKDIKNASFSTQYGHYELLVISFGVINTPVVFMCLMNQIFSHYFDMFIVLFVDDIWYIPRT